MTYYILIALQLACAYHIYKNKNSFYWYFAILLLPAIGCLVYVIAQIFNKKDVAVVQKEFTAVINPTKKISQLEKKVEFSDTYSNRVELGDALLAIGNFKEAAVQYDAVLHGNHTSDYYANTQLLIALFEQEKYDEVISIGEKMSKFSDFEKSQAQFKYGLALSKAGKDDEAEAILKKIDQRYSNYPERLALSKFYIENEMQSKALEVLHEMQDEYLNLTKPNKKLHKNTFIEVDRLVATTQS
ncbi:hypothetical protein [Dokdonia sp. R86516]|uniref:hypothetical protein n=1 Tax=Dokdonia sp. R86516 TaxID=3093856 RepID=UPI0037C97649